MGLSDKVAVVFTYKGIARICSDGGTQSWRMHHSHVGAFNYVICVRNRRHERAEGSEEHGSAFLLGKVLDVVPSTERNDPGKPRFLIRMSEAAIIHDKPDFWRWGRWPTHYDSLEALGIDPANYHFKPLPELGEEVRKKSEGLMPHITRAPAPGSRSWKDSIDQAKISLAAELGVEVSSIEIAVRM